MAPHSLSLSEITIRPAYADDNQAVVRLATLDSARVPAGPLLLAEVDGELRAALATDDGTVIADPFSRTVELIALLRKHAAVSHASPVRRRARFGLRATLRRLGDGVSQQQLASHYR
jgi:hypothetical protein